METYLGDCFAKGNVQVFVGSGLSANMYPTSAELRDKLLDDPIYVNGAQTNLRIILSKANEVSLEDAAEFYELYKKSDGLLRVIRAVYGDAKRSLDIHHKLWQLPNIRWLYTTNFDCLIEDALGRPKQPPEVITRGTDIVDIPRGRRVVFKPHGCARRSVDRSEFVITRNDYLNYSHRRTLEMLKTLYDLSTKVFLFLGYSLRDLNMRHIITEANRIGAVRSYAVLKDAYDPEYSYWRDLGVTLIQQDLDHFLSEVLETFPAYEFEFDEKEDMRVAEKDEISNKALLELKQAISQSSSLAVIIDAGSTTASLAKALSREVLAGGISVENIHIITNSPPVMDELTPAVRHSKGNLRVTVIGGPQRFGTRAYTPNEESAKTQLRSFQNSKTVTLAFIGATAIDESGLKTKTEDEVAIKEAFIDAASHVYVLVDHSKIRRLTGGHVFSGWQKDRMTIVTDRKKEMEDMKPFCKAIR